MNANSNNGINPPIHLLVDLLFITMIVMIVMNYIISLVLLIISAFDSALLFFWVSLLVYLLLFWTWLCIGSLHRPVDPELGQVGPATTGNEIVNLSVKYDEGFPSHEEAVSELS